MQEFRRVALLMAALCAGVLFQTGCEDSDSNGIPDSIDERLDEAEEELAELVDIDQFLIKNYQMAFKALFNHPETNLDRNAMFTLGYDGGCGGEVEDEVSATTTTSATGRTVNFSFEPMTTDLCFIGFQYTGNYSANGSYTVTGGTTISGEGTYSGEGLGDIIGVVYELEWDWALTYQNVGDGFGASIEGTTWVNGREYEASYQISL